MRFLLTISFTLFLVGLASITGIYAYYAPQLPSIEVLRDVRLQVPLKVYTREYELIAEFGEKRRTPTVYADIPPLMVNAFLSAEDNRFFEHPGVDYQGILRAASQLILTGKKKQGGSTITMQVARNFFLSNEKTYERKIKEILLALKIERSLNKADILELYLNKIYLGNRAYGIGAAAEVYYGVPPGELTLAQIAMIAGLPKAPSRYNPLANPNRAIIRRNYVLNRMLQLGFINQEDFNKALNSSVTAYLHAPVVKVSTPYLAENVRAMMVGYFGEDAYTAGYRVVTTIDRDSQLQANRSLRKALEDYDRRHGYRGAEETIQNIDELTIDELNEWLSRYGSVGNLLPGLVIQIMEQSVRVYIGGGQTVQIEWQGMKWARRYEDENKMGQAPEKAMDILNKGDIIRLSKNDEDLWWLAQIPDISGALIALNPINGAILSLIGGYNFYYSKFNRAIQSKRQSGSGFKPVLYSAVLEAGFTPASTVNDAPIVFKDTSMQEGAWRPENYSGKFFGPTRLRVALYKSRNLVSVRLIDSIGIKPVRQMARRMGFTDAEVPKNLTIALGSGSVAPIRMSAIYAAFANGGYRVQPYLIDKVTDIHGTVILEADPDTVCGGCIENHKLTTSPPVSASLISGLDQYRRVDPDDKIEGPEPKRIAPRILSPQIHYQIVSMLRDVIKRGTGRRAMQLGRRDLAGKTGTTNEQHDAWFNGFSPDLVATAWVGFDRFTPLGKRETGSRAALPMWMSYMGKMLADKPEADLIQPNGMVTVKINAKTGLALAPGESGGIFETFRKELAPQVGIAYIENSSDSATGKTDGEAADVRESLF